MNKYFDTDIEDQNLFENLLENYLHPLDINKGNFEDFERLAIFSESEIRLIIQYRIEAKKIFSVYELQVIEGIPLHKIEMALPFLTVGGVNQEKNILQSILSKDNTYLLLKSDRQIQENSSYPGSPYKFTGRYRSARSGDYSFGFLFEKDRGETIAFNPKSGFYGFDFYSFHLAFYNRGFVKSFMLGDFKIQSGQGLVFSSGLFSARNIDPVLSTKRSQLNFTPYTSSGESGFFRGMGITMSLSTKTDLSIFYSRKLRDAKVYATSSQTYFQAFSNSGLHRTSSELANRNTLLETNSGIIFTTQVIQGLKIGANFNYTTFNIPIYPGEEVEKIFSIQGTSHGTGSLFIDFRKNNYTIFKELAIDYNGKSAIIGGVLFNISKTMDMAMHLRNYQPGYTGFYARGEGKNAGNTNELGLYYGFNAQLFPRIKFSGYFDSYRFYWLKHNIPSPSYGREFMYKLESKLARHTEIFVLYLSSRTQQGKNIPPLDQLLTLNKHSLRFNYKTTINKKWKMGMRIQGSKIKSEETTYGLLVSHDIDYHAQKVSLSYRTTLFDTENHQNRQYIYERDLLYSFSIPSFNGTGIRRYLFIKYKPSKKLTLWIKYSNLINLMKKNTDEELSDEIKLQLKYNL